jgi:hypothetical protein
VRTIWKFPLHAPSTGFPVQEPGIVRHVATQHGKPTLWIEVDPDDERGTRYRRFEVVATGQPISAQPPFGIVYHGTVFVDALVWHIYELVQP